VKKNNLGGYMLSNEVLEKIIREREVKDMSDVNSIIKEFASQLLETMLEAELTSQIGFQKNSMDTKDTSNRRNGYSFKNLKTDLGDLKLKQPRDRDGEFDPIIVKKHQRTLEGMEEKIIQMYAHGMSERDIADFLENIYGTVFSVQALSNIISKVTELYRNWMNRPLKPIYAIIFLDAIHFNVKKDGTIKKMAVYSIMGIDLGGNKDILGLWIAETESAKYWLKVLNDLKTRNVRDILICCVDGLTGFKQAINTVFKETDVQRCIVHQVRNSLKFVSYKNKKAVAASLKEIYKAADENQAELALDAFEDKWKDSYPYIAKSWRENWIELTSFFKYPKEIRKVIYTTNPIENYHRSLRKITKPKGLFPNEDSLLKLLYLITIKLTKKWTMKIRNWGLIYSQLDILFEDRIKQID